MHRRSLIAGLAATPLAGTRALAAAGRHAYRPLFDGRSLDGWDVTGDANWAVRDAALTADRGRGGYLVSRESFRDFDLLAEFWVSPDANSGIYIRCSDRHEVTAVNAYEVNIYDTRPDPTYGTGAIVNVAKVSPMPHAGGHWNRMRITARADRFSVTLNGRRTVDGARDAKHAEGPIALQYGQGVVKFRRVMVRAG